MADYPDDPRVLEAKAMPVEDVLSRLGIGGLQRAGQEMIGPCPLCGGTDRFGINLKTKKFLCRHGDMKGGDVIALVMQHENISFPEALTWLCGEATTAVDPKERERRLAKARAAERRAQEESARYRAEAVAHAKRIWAKSRPGSDGVVAAYLRARGIDVAAIGGVPAALRFVLDHPYRKTIKGVKADLRGPAMIAGVLAPSGELRAVHQTWVSPDAPHGKRRIVVGETVFPSKLVRGSKKGGAIRLITPRGARVLVVGEGIETTLSAAVAQPFEGACYWAGVDLGNMAGLQRKIAGKRHSGLPDMSDHEAFVPPPWVERLVFIQDGDSDPAATRAKLESGLRRAMALRPGLKGQIVHAGEGVDLNDVLTGGHDVDPPDGEDV